MRLDVLGVNKSSNIIVFLIFVSLLIPLPFFYTAHRISDFVVIKFFIITMAFFLSIYISHKKTHKIVVLTVLLVLLLFVWLLYWEFDEKKIVVVYSILNPLLYLCLGLQSRIDLKSAVRVLALLLCIEIILSIYHFGLLLPWKLVPVYLGGHFSMPILMLYFFAKKSADSFVVPRVLSIISVIDLVKGEAGRFVLPVLISLTTRYVYYVGVLCLLVIYLFTIYFGKYDENYTFSAGYRVSEYVLVYDALMQCNLMIGCMLDAPFETYKLGSKGYVDVGGHFHNYWLIWVFNFGLVGLMVATYFYFKIMKSVAPYGYVIFPFIIMMFLDAPRDGHWGIGLVAAVLMNQNRKGYE